jgi:hypothetical protein
MEATVAATFSQQRPRFHKLERTCPWVAYESRCPCTSLRRFWRFYIFCLNEE